MNTRLLLPVSKTLDLLHSIKANMKDSYMDGWTPGGVVAQLVHPAEKSEFCVSLSCSSLCRTSAALSRTCC